MTRPTFLLVCAAWLTPLLASRALSQGPPPVEPLPAHAWIVTPDPVRGTATVFHLPPHWPDGAARVAAEVYQVPAAVASRAETLFLLFEPPPPGPAFQGKIQPSDRQVLSLSGLQDAGGRWITSPAGRLEGQPGVSGRGTLAGFAASRAGLFVGLTEGSTFRVEMLHGVTWQEVWRSDALKNPTLFAHSTGFGVLCDFGQNTRVGLSTTRNGSADEVQWMDAPDNGEWNAASTGDQIVLWRDTPKGLELFARRAFQDGDDEQWRKFASISVVSPVSQVSPRDDSGRLLIASANPPTPPRVASFPKVHIVSVASGRILYDGPLKLASPARTEDFAVLGALLFVVIGSVVATVFSPKEGAISLPKNASLAEAPRRAMAGTIDLGIALTIAALLRGIPASDALNPSWWMTPQGHLTGVFATLGLIGGGTMLEAALGRTPGKSLTGCRVVTMRGDADTADPDAWRLPTLWQALVRNVLKWGLPPVGLMALLDPSGRARADQFAGTGVVIPVVEDDSPD